MTIPKDLDPYTLRWVADQIDAEITRCDEMIKKFEVLGGVTPTSALWRWSRHIYRQDRRRFRHIATKTETETNRRKVRDPRV